MGFRFNCLRTPGCSGFGRFGWEEGFNRGVDVVDGDGLLGQRDFLFGDGVWRSLTVRGMGFECGTVESEGQEEKAVEGIRYRDYRIRVNQSSALIPIDVDVKSRYGAGRRRGSRSRKP